MSQKASAVKRAQQGEIQQPKVRPHQFGQEVFKSIPSRRGDDLGKRSSRNADHLSNLPASQ
jgi:hypothetical protein